MDKSNCSHSQSLRRAMEFFRSGDNLVFNSEDDLNNFQRCGNDFVVYFMLLPRSDKIRMSSLYREWLNQMIDDEIERQEYTVMMSTVIQLGRELISFRTKILNDRQQITEEFNKVFPSQLASGEKMEGCLKIDFPEHYFVHRFFTYYHQSDTPPICFIWGLMDTLNQDRFLSYLKTQN